MICAGIDAGSRSIKVALIDAATNVVHSVDIEDQGVDCAGIARALLERATTAAGIAPADIACTIATGYGRGMVSFADTTVTEITCHARGVFHLVPSKVSGDRHTMLIPEIAGSPVLACVSVRVYAPRRRAGYRL